MRSMTGFGEACVEKNGSHVQVQLSSVNRSHSDINVKLKNHPDLKRKVTGLLKNEIERGVVDVKVQSNVLEEEKKIPELNRELLEEYLEIMEELGSEYEGVEKKVRTGELIEFPGVFELKSQALQYEEAEELFLQAVEKALAELIEMREQEGEELRDDLLRRKNNIEQLLTDIEEQVPEALKNYRESLLASVESILQMPEEELQERMEDELKIYAEKCDISEEIARINSHLKQFENYLDKAGPVGRSLEFLMQELQREINTVGAKANDALISQMAVDIKSELEKCREQVKNVE
ncbi:MAG: YicC/YloC family endoribonuclease [bacterium]